MTAKLPDKWNMKKAFLETGRLLFFDICPLKGRMPRNWFLGKYYEKVIIKATVAYSNVCFISFPWF